MARRRKISNRRLRKRRRRFRIFLLLIFVVSIISLLIYSVNIFFKIKEIEINGLASYSTSEVTSNLDVKVDNSLIFFNKSKIRDSLLEEYPYINSVKITRDYPDKLVIDVVEHQEFATIYFASTHYAISQDGKVLKGITINQVNELPKIIGFEPISLEVGKTIESSDPYKEEILQEIIQIFIDYGYMDIVTEIDLTKTYDIIIKCGTKYQLEIGAIDDLDHKMKMFEEVIKKLTPSDTVIIDLSDKSYARFRNEVITPSIYP